MVRATFLASLMLLFVSAAICRAATLPDRTPVAVLTGFVGTVEIVGSTGKSPALLGMNLFENDQVHVGKGGQVTLLYQDGQIVTILGAQQPVVTVAKETYRGPGSQRVVVAKGAQDDMGGIFETRSRGVNTADLKYENLRGGDDDASLEVYPRESLIVGFAPTFEWRGKVGTEYRVLISKEGATAPFSDNKVKGSTYTYAGNLEPNTRYNWKVVPAGNDANEYVEVGFATLQPEQARAVAAARDNLMQSVSDAQSRELLLGLLYKRHELYADAIRSFAKLADLDPKNSYFHEELAWLYFKIGAIRKSQEELALAHKGK